jgi:hypothetical protein
MKFKVESTQCFGNVKKYIDKIKEVDSSLSYEPKDWGIRNVVVELKNLESLKKLSLLVNKPLILDFSSDVSEIEIYDDYREQ